MLRDSLLLVVLTLMVTRAAAVEPVRAEVKPYNGLPAMFINGRPVSGMGFLAGVSADEGVYKEIADAGIHIFMDYVSIGNATEGKRDFSRSDAYFAKIRKIDPDAYFLPRIGVTAPGWWMAKHKEDLCKFSGGVLGAQSFASEPWKRDMKEDVSAFIKHVRSSPYADRVLGFLVCTGYTGEWQAWGLWDRQMGDFSDPCAKAFRKWLTAKYRTNEALQAAWKDSSVTLDSASVPKPDERFKSSMMNFRDPVKDGMKVTDFYRFYSDLAADDIMFFAHVVKEASEGNMLAGFFYGYLNQHGMFQQDSEHNAVGRVLDCPDVDFLASPACYSTRGPGGTSNFMTMADSTRLHGKLHFDEADIRTFLSPKDDPFGRCDTPAESLAVLKREMGHVLSRGANVWWFDMTGGWFSDKRILSLLSQFKKAADEPLSGDRTGNAEIAVIYDDRSIATVRPGNLATNLMVEPEASWPRVGAPQDFYLLSDISHPNLPKHKLYVFVNAFQVSDEQIKAIHDRLKKDQATALWIYAPGYVAEDRLSTERMKRLTGINLVCSPKESRTTIKVDPSRELAKGEDWSKPIGTATPCGPLFYADDPDVEVAGTLEELGKPGFVVKKMDGWTSIFYASPYLPPEALRATAAYSGVHIYSRSNDCFYANRGIICLHSAEGGEKVINLPQKSDVYDFLTGENITRSTNEIRVTVKPKETVLMRVAIQ